MALFCAGFFVAAFGQNAVESDAVPLATIDRAVTDLIKIEQVITC